MPLVLTTSGLAVAAIGALWLGGLGAGGSTLMTPIALLLLGSIVAVLGLRCRTPDTLSVIGPLREESETVPTATPADQCHPVFDSVSNALLIFDRKGNIVEANPAACAMYGYTHEQITSLHGSAIVHEDYRHLLDEFLRRAAEGQTFLIESRDVCHDGREIDVEVRGSLLTFNGRPSLLAVVSDVTERKRARQQLEDYASALQAANRSLEEYSFAAQAATRAKSEFLANMSHEIRTPLNAILGYSELIRGEEIDAQAPDERIESLDTILRNGKHLLSLINDVLDISKIEAGRFDVEIQPFSPWQLIEDVRRLIDIRAQQKGLAFRIEVETPLPATIQSDATRLRQILINLLGNAVKFTDKGSVRLRVALRREANAPRIEFGVIDTGRGISREYLDKIFGAFTQEPLGQKDCVGGGTGLGLTISRHLAKLLGGQLSVESELGQGSMFLLDLPTGPLAGVEMVEPTDTPTYLPALPLIEKSRPAGVIRLEGRILLAEDGPDNQRLISHILRRAGAEVVAVENGAEAIAAVQQADREERPFQLVLMDIQMPVLDGFGATRELRRLGMKQPIVALTAHAMKQDRRRCIEAGCDDYATKPINRETLLRLAARHLGSARSAAPTMP